MLKICVLFVHFLFSCKRDASLSYFIILFPWQLWDAAGRNCNRHILCKHVASIFRKFPTDLWRHASQSLSPQNLLSEYNTRKPIFILYATIVGTLYMVYIYICLIHCVFTAISKLGNTVFSEKTDIKCKLQLRVLSRKPSFLLPLHTRNPSITFYSRHPFVTP